MPRTIPSPPWSSTHRSKEKEEKKTYLANVSSSAKGCSQTKAMFRVHNLAFSQGNKVPEKERNGSGLIGERVSTQRVKTTSSKHSAEMLLRKEPRPAAAAGSFNGAGQSMRPAPARWPYVEGAPLANTNNRPAAPERNMSNKHLLQLFPQPSEPLLQPTD